MPYILEVQHFNANGHNENPEWNGKCQHIGYMNKIFKTFQGLFLILAKMNL